MCWHHNPESTLGPPPHTTNDNDPTKKHIWFSAHVARTHYNAESSFPPTWLEISCAETAAWIMRKSADTSDAFFAFMAQNQSFRSAMEGVQCKRCTAVVIILKWHVRVISLDG